MMGFQLTIRMALVLSSVFAGSRLLADDGDRDIAVEINKANGLLRSGDVDGATKAYGQVQASAPDRADLSYNMAVAKYRKGDMAAAEQLFKQTSTAENDALAAKARYNLGNCNYASAIKQAEADRSAAIKNLENAIGNYRSALDIDPNDADCRANIELASAMIEKLREQEKKQQQQQKQQEQDKKQQDRQKQDQQKQDQKQKDKQDEKKQGQQQKDSQQEQNKDQQKDSQQSQKQDQQQKDQKSQEDKSKSDQAEQDKQQKVNEESKSQSSEKNESQPKEQKPQDSKTGEQDSKSQSQESKSQSQDQNKSAPADQKHQPSATQPKSTKKDRQEQDVAQPPEPQKDQKGSAAPKGSLTAADQKAGKTDKQDKELAGKPEMAPDGVMTTQEAEKMLQAIRDQEMLRRLRRQAAERNQHVPVDRDW